jgi:hypothetical protein
MRFKKLLRVMPGGAHGIYETDKGTAIKKPLGQKVKTSYWDIPSILTLLAVVIGAAIIWSLPIIAWIRTSQ